jgi:V8-like Glu-specific endopeptidase
MYLFAVSARDRYALLRMAGLKRFLAGTELTGVPRTVAGELIDKLEGFGDLPDRPKYHALGALLSHLLTLGELPRADAAFFAGLIVRYSLVADLVYIDKLRSEYDIAGDLVRKPAPERAALSVAVGARPHWSSPHLPLDQDGSAASAIRKLGLEAVIPSEDNFLDIHLLSKATYSAQAVARVEFEGEPRGTAFLVGPDLVLTAQHTLEGPDAVKGAVIRFGYVLDAAGVVQEGRAFKLRPDFYYASPWNELGYALVRLEGEPLKDVSRDEDLSIMEMVRRGVHRGYLELAPQLIAEYERVNIIQHPLGGPMKVVMTQNRVIGDMSESRVRYVANTMPGSSGAPVFNQRWDVVALHYAGRRHSLESWPGAEMFKGSTVKVNEGIPVRAILEDMRAKGIDRYLP